MGEVKQMIQAGGSYKESLTYERLVTFTNSFLSFITPLRGIFCWKIESSDIINLKTTLEEIEDVWLGG